MLRHEQSFSDSNNEVNALRHCLLKAVAATSYHRGSKSYNVKKIAIDVPCSPTVFQRNIVSNVPSLNYSGEDNYKCTVSPSDLEMCSAKIGNVLFTEEHVHKGEL